ncbi:MAG: autoinducer binding domain-containing protein [Pseudomonadota bacterium]
MNAGNGSLRAFAANLNATDQPEAIVKEAARFVQGYRLSAVLLADLTPHPDERLAPSLLSNWPTEWHIAYERMGGIAQDAMLRQASRRADPYRWSDGPDPVAAENPVPDAGGIIEAARGFARENDLNWQNGLYFPVHWPPDRSGVVALWGDPPDLSDDDETRLHMASCRAYWRWRKVTADAPEPMSGLPQLGKREIEVLSLVAAGYTDAAAARALGLTERTILHYMTRARARLACRTRAQAIAVSVRLGLI